MAKWKGADFNKTCGDCIHADICERNLNLDFSRENIAWCNSFKDKTDVVEVVRCKNCAKSRPLNPKDPFESVYCDECVWCYLRQDGVFEDHFCGDGQRKDGAGE